MCLDTFILESINNEPEGYCNKVGRPQLVIINDGLLVVNLHVLWSLVLG
jgi:hypothetical protein